MCRKSSHQSDKDLEDNLIYISPLLPMRGEKDEEKDGEAFSRRPQVIQETFFIGFKIWFFFPRFMVNSTQAFNF